MYDISAELMACGEIGRDCVLDGAQSVREFLDARGNRVSFVDRRGRDLGWEPCFEIGGAFGRIWKRPPLTTHEELENYLAKNPRFHGRKTFERALRMSCDGLASPQEARVFKMLCASVWDGGEALLPPDINRRIDLDGAAAKLVGRNYVIADMLWPAPRLILEINGAAYHAGKDGYREHGGRTAALESMGYPVSRLLCVNATILHRR